MDITKWFKPRKNSKVEPPKASFYDIPETTTPQDAQPLRDKWEKRRLRLNLTYSITMVLLFALFLFGLYFAVTEYTEKVEMYNTDAIAEAFPGSINGYADLGEGYYVVWTQGRTNNRINKTELHEASHIYIDENYEHFLKRYATSSRANYEEVCGEEW